MQCLLLQCILTYSHLLLSLSHSHNLLLIHTPAHTHSLSLSVFLRSKDTFWYDLSDSNYRPVAFLSMQKVTTPRVGKKSISHLNFFSTMDFFAAVEMTTAWRFIQLPFLKWPLLRFSMKEPNMKWTREKTGPGRVELEVGATLVDLGAGQQRPYY